jgi:methylase of polypeptide subunit release factors
LRLLPGERYGLRRWTDDTLEGGGFTFCECLRDRLAESGPYARVLDWCCGIGTIGFDLLGSSVCESIDFADVNVGALEVVERTAIENGVEGRIRTFQLARLADIAGVGPWELIVGNPPHVNSLDSSTQFRQSHISEVWQDMDWRVHREFFQDLPNAITSNGRAVLIENFRFADPDMFVKMAQEYGLERPSVAACAGGWEDYYLIELFKRV